MLSMPEIREMSVVELQEKELDLRQEIFETRMKMYTDASVLGQYRRARKDLARILTVLRERRTEEAA